MQKLLHWIVILLASSLAILFLQGGCDVEETNSTGDRGYKIIQENATQDTSGYSGEYENIKEDVLNQTNASAMLIDTANATEEAIIHGNKTLDTDCDTFVLDPFFTGTYHIKVAPQEETYNNSTDTFTLDKAWVYDPDGNSQKLIAELEHPTNGSISTSKFEISDTDEYYLSLSLAKDSVYYDHVKYTIELVD